MKRWITRKGSILGASNSSNYWIAGGLLAGLLVVYVRSRRGSIGAILLFC